MQAIVLQIWLHLHSIYSTHLAIAYLSLLPPWFLLLPMFRTRGVTTHLCLLCFFLVLYPDLA